MAHRSRTPDNVPVIKRVIYTVHNSAWEQLEDIESQKKHINRKQNQQIPSASEPRSVQVLTSDTVTVVL